MSSSRVCSSLARTQHWICGGKHGPKEGREKKPEGSQSEKQASSSRLFVCAPLALLDGESGQSLGRKNCVCLSTGIFVVNRERLVAQFLKKEWIKIANLFWQPNSKAQTPLNWRGAAWIENNELTLELHRRLKWVWSKRVNNNLGNFKYVNQRILNA